MTLYFLSFCLNPYFSVRSFKSILNIISYPDIFCNIIFNLRKYIEFSRLQKQRLHYFSQKLMQYQIKDPLRLKDATENFYCLFKSFFFLDFFTNTTANTAVTTTIKIIMHIVDTEGTRITVISFFAKSSGSTTLSLNPTITSPS